MGIGLRDMGKVVFNLIFFGFFFSPVKVKNKSFRDQLLRRIYLSKFHSYPMHFYTFALTILTFPI
jgi:hypothetical protein